VYEQLTGQAYLVPRVLSLVRVMIDCFAVGVMSIYPRFSWERIVAPTPVDHPRDPRPRRAEDLATALRAYIVGQLLTMTFLAAPTAAGTLHTDVPTG